MAEENIIFNTKVNTGGSAESIKSVKTELRQLKNEMAGLEPGSAAFTKAAQRAGELQDKIEDANNAVKAFNPEAKFQAFAGVLGGVANGFSAAQGAMALFGSENKDIEQAILKTQGAIAIATGVNGLLGMKDAFVILSSVIKTQVVAAFGTMRAAIISTGILGLVTLIGTLIYQWYEEKKANDAATEALKKYNEEQQKSGKYIQDLAIRRLKGREREYAELKKSHTDEILELEKRIKDEQILEENARLLRNQLTETQSAEEAMIKEKWRLEDENKEREKSERLKKLREEEIAREQKYNEIRFSDGEKYTDSLAKLNEDEQRLADERAQRDLEELEKTVEINNAKVDLSKLTTKVTVDDLNTVANALNGVGALVGEQTEAGKALGIASATIDTYVGANKAFAQGGLLGFIAAAGVIAAGLANVRRIMSVQVPKTSRKSSSFGGGGGGGGAVAPIIPPASNATRLTNSNEPIITRELNVKDNRVYVLEKDITSTQDRVAAIREKATIQ